MVKNRRGILFVVLAAALSVSFAPLFMPYRLKVRDIVWKEKYAVWTMRLIVAAEISFAHTSAVDQDGDGIGEYGFLSELLDEGLGRSGSSAVPRHLLSQCLLEKGEILSSEIIKDRDYCYQIFLPGADEPISDRESHSGGALSGKEPHAQNRAQVINLREDHFVAYAWPVEYGRTGLRAFAVSEKAQVYATCGRSLPSARGFSGLGSVIPGAIGTFSAVAGLLLLICRLHKLRPEPPLWLIAAMFCCWLLAFGVALEQCVATSSSPPVLKPYSNMQVMPKPGAFFRKEQPAFRGGIGDGEGNDGNQWIAVR